MGDVCGVAYGVVCMMHVVWCMLHDGWCMMDGV